MQVAVGADVLEVERLHVHVEDDAVRHAILMEQIDDLLQQIAPPHAPHPRDHLDHRLPQEPLDPVEIDSSSIHESCNPPGEIFRYVEKHRRRCADASQPLGTPAALERASLEASSYAEAAKWVHTMKATPCTATH